MAGPRRELPSPRFGTTGSADPKANTCSFTKQIFIDDLRPWLLLLTDGPNDC